MHVQRLAWFVLLPRGDTTPLASVIDALALERVIRREAVLLEFLFLDGRDSDCALHLAGGANVIAEYERGH